MWCQENRQKMSYLCLILALKRRLSESVEIKTSHRHDAGVEKSRARVLNERARLLERRVRTELHAVPALAVALRARRRSAG